MVVLALALLPGGVLAQKADRPAVQVGDQWHFVLYYSVPSTTPNRLWVVRSTGPGGIEATENGEPLTLTRDLNIRESPTQKYSNQQALRFPLRVGQRWRYETDWVFKPKQSQGHAVVKVHVQLREKVTVPAGEFDAFKLVSKSGVSGTSPIRSQYAGEITTTYWYAPAARAIVKSVTHNPYLGTSTVELVRLQLQE
jgi:hypothetical protein